MKEALEEYVYCVIAIIGCAILMGGIWAGLDDGGFLREPIVRYIETLIG